MNVYLFLDCRKNVYLHVPLKTMYFRLLRETPLFLIYSSVNNNRRSDEREDYSWRRKWDFGVRENFNLIIPRFFPTLLCFHQNKINCYEKMITIMFPVWVELKISMYNYKLRNYLLVNEHFKILEGYFDYILLCCERNKFISIINKYNLTSISVWKFRFWV